MTQLKTQNYQIKLGHLHGQTKSTKEYYSFNTFYMHGFRDKYGIISSSINNEFYRAIFLLSICWYYGGHLLIVNTNNHYSQLLYNLMKKRQQITDKKNTKFLLQSNPPLGISKMGALWGGPEKVDNQKHEQRSPRGSKRAHRKGAASLFKNPHYGGPTGGYTTDIQRYENKLSYWQGVWKRAEKDLLKGKQLLESGKLWEVKKPSEKISLSSGKSGGILTNWKELSSSAIREGRFDLEFGKFLSENKSVELDFRNKGASSPRRLFYKKNGQLRRPDCILYIGDPNGDTVRNAFSINIPTIVSIDTHWSYNFCTYPIWGNTQSVVFILSVLEWFFRYSSTTLHPDCGWLGPSGGGRENQKI